MQSSGLVVVQTHKACTIEVYQRKTCAAQLSFRSYHGKSGPCLCSKFRATRFAIHAAVKVMDTGLNGGVFVRCDSHPQLRLEALDKITFEEQLDRERHNCRIWAIAPRSPTSIAAYRFSRSSRLYRFRSHGWPVEFRKPSAAGHLRGHRRS